MTTPNRITLLRIALIPGLVICALQTRETPVLRWTALCILVVSLISDILDGWIARRRNQATRLGAFLDPLADKLLFSTLFICLALPLWPGRLLPHWVAVVTISRDLYVSLGILVVYMMTGGVRVKPSTFGKANTVALSVVGVSALAGLPSLLVLGAAWVSVALSGITWIQYSVEGMRQLSLAEQPRDEQEIDAMKGNPL